MSDIVFQPFDKQRLVLKDQKRIKGAFAGKRGGKSEVGAVQGILWQESKPDWQNNKIDPYLGVIIAPTFDMLRRLSLKKFLAYSQPFIKTHNKSTHEIKWWDDNPRKGHGSEVYGLSAEKPERIEGIKANWVWLDEIFSMSEQTFLEARARIADSKGRMICTGSLGVQHINPKQHWAYKYFKQNPDPELFSCYEWSTADNPYFDRQELESLQSTLDPVTYRAMFEINWDTIPKNAVYGDFTDANILTNLAYSPEMPTFVSVDWGFAHDMAVGFFQYDVIHDRVYLIDEIVKPRMTLDDLWGQIVARPYRIDGYCCDIAGSQEREITGLSNIKYMKKNYHIDFKRRSSSIAHGISLVRSYIKNAKGQTRFYVSSKCQKFIDGLKQYAYPEKDGVILNENPVKKNDDAVDSLRYFFVNYLDRNYDNSRTEVRSVR